MRNDDRTAWRERGAAFGNVGALHGGESRPSRWRILQFAVRRLFLKKWSFMPNFQTLLPNFSQSQREVESEAQGLPMPLLNLGDIRVRVQVDVESCDESQKEVSLNSKRP